MNEQEFQSRMSDLMDKITDLPTDEQQRLQALAEETRKRHGRMKKTIGELQDSLDYLRLSVKYLVFDLEATRRENKYLRGLLDEHGTPPNEEGAD